MRYGLYLHDFRQKAILVYTLKGEKVEDLRNEANTFLKTPEGLNLCRGYKDIVFRLDVEKNVSKTFKNKNSEVAWYEIRKIEKESP